MKSPGVSSSLSGLGAGFAPAPRARTAGFDQALQQARFTLSNHAAQRLSRRGLTMDSDQAARLDGGLDQLAARGSETSLVLMDEMALLVKVPQRMVMTAMSQSAMRDGVVTRIDSAVVV